MKWRRSVFLSAALAATIFLAPGGAVAQTAVPGTSQTIQDLQPDAWTQQPPNGAREKVTPEGAVQGVWTCGTVVTKYEKHSDSHTYCGYRKVDYPAPHPPDPGQGWYCSDGNNTTAEYILLNTAHSCGFKQGSTPTIQLSGLTWHQFPGTAASTTAASPTAPSGQMLEPAGLDTDDPSLPNPSDPGPVQGTVQKTLRVGANSGMPLLRADGPVSLSDDHTALFTARATYIDGQPLPAPPQTPSVVDIGAAVIVGTLHDASYEEAPAPDDPEGAGEAIGSAGDLIGGTVLRIESAVETELLLDARRQALDRARAENPDGTHVQVQLVTSCNGGACSVWVNYPGEDTIEPLTPRVVLSQWLGISEEASLGQMETGEWHGTQRQQVEIVGTGGLDPQLIRQGALDNNAPCPATCIGEAPGVDRYRLKEEPELPKTHPE